MRLIPVEDRCVVDPTAVFFGPLIDLLPQLQEEFAVFGRVRLFQVRLPRPIQRPVQALDEPDRIAPMETVYAQELRLAGFLPGE